MTTREYGEPGRPRIVEILQAAIEVAAQAPYDLCGEQRAFYLPRLEKIKMGLMQWFPSEVGPAFKEAVDTWGDKLCSKT